MMPLAYLLRMELLLVGLLLLLLLLLPLLLGSSPHVLCLEKEEYSHTRTAA
jgi:hypothetical protein